MDIVRCLFPQNAQRPFDVQEKDAKGRFKQMLDSEIYQGQAWFSTVTVLVELVRFRLQLFSVTFTFN